MNLHLNYLKNILIDADDTLWYDSIYFKKLESAFLNFCINKLKIFDDKILNRLNSNLKNTRKGEIGFIDAILKTLSDFNAPNQYIIEFESEINIFRNHPIELLPNVEDFLIRQSNRRKFIITKGIFYEQIVKLYKSKLLKYFDNVIILGKKNGVSIENCIKLLEISKAETLMIGNSIKHDIIPSISIGLKAIWLNHDQNLNNSKDKAPKEVFEINNWQGIINLFEN